MCYKAKLIFLKGLKAVFVFNLLLCFAASSIGQTVWFNGGVAFTKMNLKYTSLFGDHWQSSDSAQYPSNLSLEFEYRERKKTSLSSEFGSYRVAYRDLSIRNGFELDIPYLYLQQMFNYYPVRFGNFKPQVSAGIRVERISDKAETPNSSLYYYEQEKLLNRINFGFTGKIGIQYHQPKYGFKLNYIYFQKFRNVIESEEGKAVNRYYSSIIGRETVSFINLGVFLKLNRERDEFNDGK
jgi:hypothetical protein